ncbi:MAG: hydrolase [Pseudonocardiales bacterium]|nr:hydrolase [Pseudonocardiales bacterium]
MVPAWLDQLRAAAVGVQAHEIARFLPPHDGSGRRSAVLVLFGDSAAGPSILLCERATTLRSHAGQVSFPGGKTDPGDPDATATALREATEEVGLDPATADVFAVLPDLFLHVTGFIVTPVLAYWREPHLVSAVDAAEVARVVVVPIDELAAAANRFTVRHPSGYNGPGFAAGELFVWGFTAMILDAILRLGGWEQPWDAGVLRDIPESAGPSEPVTGQLGDPLAEQPADPVTPSAAAGTVEP